MLKPIVSIVVPCYKKVQYLPEALNSILAQTYPYWECVIVNDGSPDNTEEVAKCYCEKDVRFHYLSQSNKGVSVARNNGIRQMDGKYILALDADDWISDSYLEKAVNYLEGHADVRLVYSRYEVFNSIESHEWILPPYTYERFIMGDVAIVCSAIYRRTDFDRIGGYDESMQGFEDWDLWLSLLGEDDEVYRLDEVLFHYRTESSVVTKQVSQNEKHFRCRLCKKHEDIYKPRFENLLYYYRAFQDLNLVCDELERVKKVYSSYAYRLGKFLLKPISWIKK